MRINFSEKLTKIIEDQKDQFNKALVTLGIRSSGDDWESLLNLYGQYIRNLIEVQIYLISFIKESISQKEGQTQRIIDWASQFEEYSKVQALFYQENMLNWIDSIKESDPSSILTEDQYEEIRDKWQMIIQKSFDSNTEWIQLWKSEKQ